MTNLNEAANMDHNDDLVSPNNALAGSGIVNWLNSVIHRTWDILDVDWDKGLPGLRWTAMTEIVTPAVAAAASNRPASPFHLE